MVFTDSCWALAMNEQVLTTMTSASSAPETRVAPACTSIPIITSLSTRFFGHPRLTKPTLVGAGVALSVALSTGGDKVFTGMQSLDFNTVAGLLPVSAAADRRNLFIQLWQTPHMLDRVVEARALVVPGKFRDLGANSSIVNQADEFFGRLCG